MPIGELARRSGVAASALRFYEAQGLIHGSRSASGRRQYPRDTLRRVAFLRAGQRVGLSLDELRQALASIRRLELGDFSLGFSGSAPYVASNFVELTVLGANGKRLG